MPSAAHIDALPTLEEILGHLTVSDVMTTDVLVVRPSTPVTELIDGEERLVNDCRVHDRLGFAVPAAYLVHHAAKADRARGA